MTASLSSLVVAVAALAGGVLVFSGYRLYRTALATVGAGLGVLAGWYLGGLMGPIEVAAGAAIVGGVAGALLAGPVEAGLRLVAGGLAAAVLVGVAAGGTGSGDGMVWALAGGAFVVGAVAALLLHRPLVVSAFAASGGLLAAAAGLVAGDPELVRPGLGPTVDGLTTTMHGQLPAVLAVAAICIAAGLVVQADEGGQGVSGSRPGLRSGGALLSLLLAAGLLAASLPGDALLPGSALAITGVGPLSWSLGLLFLPAALGAAHRWGADAWSLRGWLLGVVFGFGVAGGAAVAGSALPDGPLVSTGFLASFTAGPEELRLAKLGWTLAGFPILFAVLVLLPAGRGRGRASRAEGDDEG